MAFREHSYGTFPRFLFVASLAAPLSAQTTQRVNVRPDGTQTVEFSSNPAVSANGLCVAFRSGDHIAPNDWNMTFDVYLRDRGAGTTELVSMSTAGDPGNAYSGSALGGFAISADGRYVAFESTAWNLVPGDTNGHLDVFVRDRQLGTTELVSAAPGGEFGNNESGEPSISADGRYVAFTSLASNLVPGDTNADEDVFVRDLVTGATERVSVTNAGAEQNRGALEPAISADGRFVVFKSGSTNLVPDDTNGVEDSFVRDLATGTTARVDLAYDGAQANGGGSDPVISSDGRCIAFSSYSTNLVPGDTNATSDIFVRDLDGGPRWQSLCFPGYDGTIGCPCGNDPVFVGGGCENSAATGGALLFASGGTYLSSDTLVLRTSGEKPTATSVLLQGNGVAALGIVYGQGVRCVTGTLRRLFTKTASGGMVTIPDFAAGDPTISARSAAKGVPISPGEDRAYLVFYRDPIVLGGCPAGSTFNATQTGVVNWAP